MATHIDGSDQRRLIYHGIVTPHHGIDLGQLWIRLWPAALQHQALTSVMYVNLLICQTMST